MAKKEIEFAFRGRFIDALAALGEAWQDTGNGAVKVLTHAGLSVTLTIRDKSPKREIRARLLKIYNASLSGKKTPFDAKAGDRALLGRGLIERPEGKTAVITRAGKIAASRFMRMPAKAFRDDDGIQA